MTIEALLAPVSIGMACFFGLFSGCFFWLNRKTRHKVVTLRQQKQRTSKRRKKQAYRIRKKQNEANAQRKKSFVFLFLALVLGATGGGIQRYQRITLQSEDAKAVTNGYVFLRDLEEELGKGADLSRERVSQIASKLASYGVLRANTRNTSDGQQRLNRYYQAMKQLGVNITAQVSTLADHPEQAEVFQADSRQVQTYEAAVFTYYRVDEAALKQAKASH